MTKKPHNVDILTLDELESKEINNIIDLAIDLKKELKKGDKVTTVGGIYGKVTGLKEGKIILEISDNTRITIDMNSISREKSIQNHK